MYAEARFVSSTYSSSFQMIMGILQRAYSDQVKEMDAFNFLSYEMKVIVLISFFYIWKFTIICICRGY